MAAENATRGKEINSIIAGIDSISPRSVSDPVILSGDFNSGSHLDWTRDTEKMHFGYRIEWPGSVHAHQSGFLDAYRQIHPDPVKDRGITWSTIKHGDDPRYQNDRIDFIYFRGKPLKALDANVIDSGTGRFPSDHAAITALFKVSPN